MRPGALSHRPPSFTALITGRAPLNISSAACARPTSKRETRGPPDDADISSSARASTVARRAARSARHQTLEGGFEAVLSRRPMDLLVPPKSVCTRPCARPAGPARYVPETAPLPPMDATPRRRLSRPQCSPLVPHPHVGTELARHGRLRSVTRAASAVSSEATVGGDGRP